MVVKIGTGSLLFTLTSPPPSPEPYPEEALIAKTVHYDDRDIVVTIPFPDTIEVVIDILNEHLDSPWETGSAKWIYTELDKQIVEFINGFKTGESYFSPAPVLKFGLKAGVIFSLPYDADQPLNRGRLELQRRKGPEYPVWTFRLEFSPRKAGPLGLVKLIAQIEEAVGFLNLPRVCNSARISRVDAAVDCIGAKPIDLIAHIPKPGKRMVFVGDGGTPESVYFYEKKKSLDAPPTKLSTKSRGPLRLVLYERRDYHLQLCLPPPYGACPVTRAEVSCRWNKNRPLLSEIGCIKNLFAGRRVRYAAPVGKSTREWQKFCMSAFGAGVTEASFAWLPGNGFKFSEMYLKCDADLVDHSCWDRWADGLALTGMDKFVSGNL